MRLCTDRGHGPIESPLANMVINLVLNKNVWISSDKRFSTDRGHGPVESPLVNMAINLVLHKNVWISSDKRLSTKRGHDPVEPSCEHGIKLSTSAHEFFDPQ
jgi:hypothetical protein